MSTSLGLRFPSKEFFVDPARVDEFVFALGIEPQPGYRAVVGEVVPPGFLMYVTTYGAEAIHSALDFDMLRTVFGGSEIEYRQPVRIGERLTVSPWISNVTAKVGRTGRLTIVELTVEYSLGGGSVVAVERSNTVEREWSS